jgi:hypothetical protein
VKSAVRGCTNVDETLINLKYKFDAQMKNNYVYRPAGEDERFADTYNSIVTNAINYRKCKKYKPLEWKDADFWRVLKPWSRVEHNLPMSVTPPKLLFLLKGTHSDRMHRLMDAFLVNHHFFVEYLTAHGASYIFQLHHAKNLKYKEESIEAYHNGVERYRINVMQIKTALCTVYTDDLGSLILDFLSPGHLRWPASNGICLCMHCSQ